MKKLINILVFVSASLMATSSFTYNSDPKIFITELVDDAINTLSDKNMISYSKGSKTNINFKAFKIISIIFIFYYNFNLL